MIDANRPVIQFDSVSRSFGNQVALHNVTFEVPPGVVFALLGENGAGKTTSIKAILGMCEPQQGRISVLGIDPTANPAEIRKQCGYVPEQPSLYDWMTVAEAGWFAAGFYPAGYQQEYDRLTQNFQLPRHQKIKHLSKGTRAKVVLSLAMAHKPPLLILDEPTSGLDALVRREFLESMVDMTAAGQTVFLSSHQISEVERVADIVAIMKQGELLIVDELSTLKESCREVIVTFEDQVNPSIIPGKVVRHVVQGRQFSCLVRTDNDRQYHKLQDHSDVRTVEVVHPTLEEIFVAYMRGSRLPASGYASMHALEKETMP